ncbi:lipoate-protein ligase A [Bifidobacterium goeldii]|uniref:Lipoate-protein ligase A n=1 Tax=Bifidobacterium goeldii TaxID=2306975 RepID=A0A430FKS5_9BIFI|nr:lipoate--protein ligase family protein [Bifidobacterium goeldii]RSX53437.1 lipoate-protein ligase A [Bifidobacterium goeldii]
MCSRVMRGEYKTPGGKLVGVNVTVDAQSGRATACHVDGDFFVEGDDTAANTLIADIEHALIAGKPIAPVINQHRSVRIVGTDATAIETAFARAVGNSTASKSAANRPHSSTQHSSTQHSNTQHSIADIASPTQLADWRNRWRQLSPVIVRDTPRSPADQMMIDEQWAREVAAGRRPATIRFWQWAAPAVVVGRFQSIPDEVHEDIAAREGFAIVRRCTGGGAMFIEPGNTITYSLYAPRDFATGISIEESYRLCDMWLVAALRNLGLTVHFGGLNDIASQHGKIGGAAQRRFAPTGGGPGAILHHVTLAYDIDASTMARVLNTSPEKLSDKAVKSAVKRVDPLRSQTGLSREAVIDQLVNSLERGDVLDAGEL